MGVTNFDTVQSGFCDEVQKVLSASTGACATDMYGAVQAGLNVITYDGGAGAYTLVAPNSGSPNPPSGSAASLGITANNGDDGKIVGIMSTTAQAHVITTPASAIQGSKNTITFAAIGDGIVMRAYGGVWYPICSYGTATLGGA